MIRVFVISAAIIIAAPALADQWYGVSPNNQSQSNGAYGGYHDSYQSPQNDGAYRQYEQERVNRQQYRDDH